MRNEKHNQKLFTVNEEINQTLERLYTDYLTMPQVGPNQKVVRGDRPIHIACRNSSLKVLGKIFTQKFPTVVIFSFFAKM